MDRRELPDLQHWSARQFEARYDELLHAMHKLPDNVHCIQCSRSRGCLYSTFCTDSERLTRCHYCVRCTLCSDCSHCRASSRMIACHHCVESENCISSAYVIRSVGLSDCTYCFGCVGLSDCDFHILNEPYERTEYFAIVGHLSRQLGLR